jgi:hypothetical protein
MNVLKITCIVQLLWACFLFTLSQCANFTRLTAESYFYRQYIPAVMHACDGSRFGQVSGIMERFYVYSTSCWVLDHCDVSPRDNTILHVLDVLRWLCRDTRYVLITCVVYCLPVTLIWFQYYSVVVENQGYRIMQRPAKAQMCRFRTHLHVWRSVIVD